MKKTLRLLALALGIACTTWFVAHNKDLGTAKEMHPGSPTNIAAEHARQEAMRASASARSMPRNLEEYVASLTPERRAALKRTLAVLSQRVPPTAQATAGSSASGASQPVVHDALTPIILGQPGNH